MLTLRVRQYKGASGISQLELGERSVSHTHSITLGTHAHKLTKQTLANAQN